MQPSALLAICLGSTWLCGSANPAGASPLFDPFLERFQVGAFSDPEEITLAAGFPMGLLEPIRVERNWTRAAHEVLRSGGPDRRSPHLTLRLLAHLECPEPGRAWLRKCDFLVAELEAKSVAADFPVLGENSFLGSEVLARRVFLALGEGKLALAAELAGRLAVAGDDGGVSARATFVWELRCRLLEELSGLSETRFPSRYWGSMLDLVPFDAGNAWALWVAHCRALGLPVLPSELATDQGEEFLTQLQQGWFSPEALYASEFSEPAQSALGATLFLGQELAGHMVRFPSPPRDFERQGFWVKGARFARRGQAEAYESLASRSDLGPGWRLDCLRRASELRLLAGQEEPGLKDLEEALAIAARNEGTLSLRRRLRQWSEQAMVLALARRDTVLARKIHGQAQGSFQQEEGAAFVAETAYWLPVLYPEEMVADTIPPGDRTDLARRRVEAGNARPLEAADSGMRAELLAADGQSLWETWIRWGLALAQAQGLTEDRQLGASKYREILESGREGIGNAEEMEATGLACVAARLGSGPVRQRLLEMALDLDIARAGGWNGPVRPSVVPELVKELRSSQLDLHALLGFCLAAGDLRGILAVAVALPDKGLTREEKLRFLYPLPGEGSLRQAIVAQDAEPALVLAVARNESLFEPNVRSRAGALGFMQIMPFHYESKGALPGADNWACPEVSIRKGARILVENRRRYRGDPYLAVAAYNAGPGAASRWEEQLDGNPDRDIYLAWIGYPETRRYVEKVLIDREIYAWILTARFAD